MDTAELRELIDLAKQAGLEGDGLSAFLRDERARQREHEKEEREREKEDADRRHQREKEDADRRH